MKHFYTLLALLGVASIGAAFDYESGKAVDKYGIFTPAQIQTEQSNGYRPTSIDFASSTGGVKFAVSFVANSGTYYKQNTFKFAQTSQGVINMVNAGWEVMDIEPYRIGGTTYLAAIYYKGVPSTGAFYYYTEAQVKTHLGSTRRLIDLDADLINGTYYYSGVSVANTGGAYKPWGYYFFATQSAINTWSNQNGMRIIDLNRRPDGKYAAVMVKKSANERTFPNFAPLTKVLLDTLILNEGYRVQNLQLISGSYVAVLTNDLSDHEKEVFVSTRAKTNGTIGFFLKRTDSALSLADFRSYDKFHPSSTIKALIGFHVARNTSEATLNTKKVTVDGVQKTVANAVTRMMQESHNPSTNALVSLYGRTNINITAHSVVGMTSLTNLVNTFGSGGPYGNDNITYTTLRDMGDLWEDIRAGSSLTATRRTWLTSKILNQTNSGMVTKAVNECGSTASTTAKNYVKNNVELLYKAGNNSDPDTDVNGYLSIAGIFSIPHKSGNVYVKKVYTFGLWINKATSNTVDLGTQVSILMRAAAKEALNTY